MEAGEQVILLCRREKYPTIQAPNGATLSGGFKRAELLITVNGREHKISLPESPQLEFLPNTDAVVSCTFSGTGCQNISPPFKRSIELNLNTALSTVSELNGQELFPIGATPNFRDNCLNPDYSVWGRTRFVNGALRFEFSSQAGLQKPESLNGKTKVGIMLVPKNEGKEYLGLRTAQNPSSWGEATCTVKEVSID